MSMEESKRDIETTSPPSRKCKSVAFVLAQFGLELMRVLDNFNKENFNTTGSLRIGNIDAL